MVCRDMSKVSYFEIREICMQIFTVNSPTSSLLGEDLGYVVYVSIEIGCVAAAAQHQNNLKGIQRAKI